MILIIEPNESESEKLTPVEEELIREYLGVDDIYGLESQEVIAVIDEIRGQFPDEDWSELDEQLSDLEKNDI